MSDAHITCYAHNTRLYHYSTQTILPSARDGLIFSIMLVRTVSRLRFDLNPDMNGSKMFLKHGYMDTPSNILSGLFLYTYGIIPATNCQTPWQWVKGWLYKPFIGITWNPHISIVSCCWTSSCPSASAGTTSRQTYVHVNVVMSPTFMKLSVV